MIPKFCENFLNSSGFYSPTDEGILRSAVVKAYEIMGFNTPRIVINKSPMEFFENVQLHGGFSTWINHKFFYSMRSKPSLHSKYRMKDQLHPFLMVDLEHLIESRIGEILSNFNTYDAIEDALKLRGRDFYYPPEHDIFMPKNLIWICKYAFCNLIGITHNIKSNYRVDIMKDIAYQCELLWSFNDVCFVSKKPILSKFAGNTMHKETWCYEDGFSLWSSNIPNINMSDA